MAKYTVKTTDNRNLVIEADSYGLDYTQTSYEFTKDGNKVATIPASPYVFAILLNDVEESDYYWVYDWNEEENKENETETETDDVCLDCRFKEFLESEEFFNEVYEIVEAYHSPDDYEDVPDPLPEPLTIYKAITPDSPNGAWGFWYNDDTKGDVFVPFGMNRAYAETGLDQHTKGTRDWRVTPLDKTTLIPEQPKGPEPLTAYLASIGGTKVWGFWYHDAIKGDVFVPYGTSKEGVEEGIKRHKEGTRGWSTCPLSKATPVSETIQ